MITQHTPGPWVTLERYTNRQAIPVGRRRDSLAHDIFAEAHGHNCEANARLIAAAPDLLKALTQLLDRLGGHQFSEVDRVFLNNAREAIAKATGLQEETHQPKTEPNSNFGDYSEACPECGCRSYHSLMCSQREP